MSFINAIKHFQTITRHKIMVMESCFKVGLYKQGLLHDMSKYSPEEFKTGINYYQGTRSPNAAEKEAIGYSLAWLHHKGRNKHHFEYWIDFAPDKGKGLIGNRMPLNYLIEMVMDRIAASKVYRGQQYVDASALEYYLMSKDYFVMHEKTRSSLEKLLTILKEQGEEKTFAYIRRLLKEDKRRKREKKKSIPGRRRLTE